MALPTPRPVVARPQHRQVLGRRGHASPSYVRFLSQPAAVQLHAGTHVADGTDPLPLTEMAGYDDLQAVLDDYETRIAALEAAAARQTR